MRTTDPMDDPEFRRMVETTSNPYEVPAFLALFDQEVRKADANVDQFLLAVRMICKREKDHSKRMGMVFSTITHAWDVAHETTGQEIPPTGVRVVLSALLLRIVEMEEVTNK